MSLGYFNSLNMLKSLRDMNSDTTSSAITTSAQTALAAATAATAAKIPTMKHLNLGAHDVIDAIGKEREQDARQVSTFDTMMHVDYFLNVFVCVCVGLIFNFTTCFVATA